jgi:hypothetical protein
MDQHSFALLLAILGATYLVTAVIAKMTGDAVRDIRLMAAFGISLGGLATAMMVL